VTDCKSTANKRCGDCDACQRRRDRVATVAFYALILAAGASIGIIIAGWCTGGRMDSIGWPHGGAVGVALFGVALVVVAMALADTNRRQAPRHSFSGAGMAITCASGDAPTVTRTQRGLLVVCEVK